MLDSLFVGSEGLLEGGCGGFGFLLGLEEEVLEVLALLLELLDFGLVFLGCLVEGFYL